MILHPEPVRRSVNYHVWRAILIVLCGGFALKVLLLAGFLTYDWCCR